MASHTKCRRPKIIGVPYLRGGSERLVLGTQAELEPAEVVGRNLDYKYNDVTGPDEAQQIMYIDSQ